LSSSRPAPSAVAPRLPDLLPDAPAAARKLVAPVLAGSADALALAQLAARAKPVLVLSASALDAQRLVEEVAWFAPQLRVCLLPDWETLPYDSFSPHQDLVSERLASLYRIQRGDFDLAVVSAPTALVRLCPPAYLAARTFFLEQGKRLDLGALREQMAVAGYHHVTQVVAPGEFCVRGGLIDLFPTGSQLPYRIDLDDDVIETIRAFDVDTQRTLYAVREVRLLPAREFPLDDAGRARFRSRFREVFEGDPSKQGVYRDVSNGVASAGIEYYLPLFFEEVATLFDYLPAQTTIVRHGDVPAAADAFWRDASSRYRLLGGTRERPLLPPQAIFLPAEEFHVAAKRFARADLEAELAAEPLPTLAEPGVEESEPGAIDGI
jgi:transcription-repair coupling factor (superfamily II helicase)